MASGTTDTKAVDSKAASEFDQKKVSYTPLGEADEISLTVGMVRKVIAVPTKQGFLPTDADLISFVMLCQARRLNPFVGDSYLIGYDTNDGPKFNLITAVQALDKRAEIHPEMDGIEFGVIVQVNDEPPLERAGTMVYGKEKLLGGWARLWRKDRKIPLYDSLPLSVYSTGRSRWGIDPAGQIAKCARASVLRKGFPSQIAGLYLEEEFSAINGEVLNRTETPTTPKVTNQAKTLNDVAAQMKTRQPSTDEAAHDPAPEEPSRQVKEEPKQERSEPENGEIVLAYRDRLAKAKKAVELEALQADLLSESELSEATVTKLLNEVAEKLSKK